MAEEFKGWTVPEKAVDNMNGDKEESQSNFQWEMIKDLQAERDFYRDMVASKDKKLEKCLEMLRVEQVKS